MGPLGGAKKTKNIQNSNNFHDFRFWGYFLRLKLLLSAGTILGLEFMKRARDSSNHFEKLGSEVNFMAKTTKITKNKKYIKIHGGAPWGPIWGPKGAHHVF